MRNELIMNKLPFSYGSILNGCDSVEIKLDDNDDDDSHTEEESVTDNIEVGIGGEIEKEGRNKEGIEQTMPIKKSSTDQSTQVLSSDDTTGCRPTTEVLEFQSASIMETAGREEVEALYMTGTHLFSKRRSSS